MKVVSPICGNGGIVQPSPDFHNSISLVWCGGGSWGAISQRGSCPRSIVQTKRSVEIPSAVQGCHGAHLRAPLNNINCVYGLRNEIVMDALMNCKSASEIVARILDDFCAFDE